MCTRVCIASHIACGGDFLHVEEILFTHALDDSFDRMFRNAHVHGYLVTPPSPPRILHARELRKLPSANARPRNEKKIVPVY